MRVRPALLFVAAALAFAAKAEGVRAQGWGPLVLTLPASTRAAAMGDAFGMSLVDSDAVFYNAAFSDRLRGAGASEVRYGRHGALHTFSAGTDWFGGAIGLGVRGLDYGVPAAGVGVGSAADALFGGGESTLSERVLAVVYGRRVRGVRLAFTAKHFRQRGLDERSELVVGDLATAFTYRFLNIGASVHNLGPLDYEVAGQSVDVPLRGRLDLATVRSYPVGPLDVAGSAAVSYVRGGRVEPAAGVELAYWPVTGRTFFLRAGLRRADEGGRPHTLGAGFAGDKIVLDYALEPFEQGRRAHRFGVKWR